MAEPDKITCSFCGQSKEARQMMPFELIREPILSLIKRDKPGLPQTGYVCLEDLNHYRNLYIKVMLEEEKGDLTSMENVVLASIKEQEFLSKNINAEFEGVQTFGAKIADKIASFGGSWNFILLFLVLILIWISSNSFLLLQRPFDPYPFILLNLILSCIAALQAPVIMMSQNRQESKDRMRSEHDYVVNLKAELEIRNLNSKIDQLISHQWQRLMEIQQIQMDMMQELIQHTQQGKP